MDRKPLFAAMAHVLESELAWLRLKAAAEALGRAFDEEKYRPDQPRAPRGTPEGGQWVVDPASARQRLLRDERVLVAQFDGRGPIDLRDYEGVHGGHTIRVHVGKSDAFMLARVGAAAWHYGLLSGIMYRSGSFPSLEAANKLVNATLARNRDMVLAVAQGIRPDAFITAEFESPTGREAFRRTMFAQPFMRVTTGVGILIVHDPDFPHGFRIVTAYPRSE